MKRRVTAWLTILAMFAGVVLPAHAAGHLARAVDPAADLCSAKPAKQAPASPAKSYADECAKCCACSGGAVLPPLAGATLTVAARVAAQVAYATVSSGFDRDIVRVRGPPLCA